MTIPIFIIVKDRLEVLKDSVASYLKNIDTPISLVFHNSGTTYEPTLEYLKEMESQGHKVYWNEKHQKEFTRPNRPFKEIIKEQETVNESILDYRSKYHPDYYVLTDPDIAIDPGAGDILEFYKHLLNLEKATGIGPQLRIDDIPDHYPLKEKMLKRMVYFWNIRSKAIQVPWKDSLVDAVVCNIDSTFQLRPGLILWEKLKGKYLRTYEPYTAAHLDWYIDPDNLTGDQIWYLKTCGSEHMHWSNKSLKHS